MVRATGESQRGYGKAGSLSVLPPNSELEGPRSELGPARAGEGLPSTCLGVGEASGRRGAQRLAQAALSAASHWISPCPPIGASDKQPLPQVFSTYSNEDYDRRNEDVDPMAASAEYELEKRVERLELFPVELEKGELGHLGLRLVPTSTLGGPSGLPLRCSAASNWASVSTPQPHSLSPAQTPTTTRPRRSTVGWALGSVGRATMGQ